MYKRWPKLNVGSNTEYQQGISNKSVGKKTRIYCLCTERSSLTECRWIHSGLDI